jgi:(R,R)-butanediol dehydrogenase / meso-butanediol dehydrogenase / diacetyl reductase
VKAIVWQGPEQMEIGERPDPPDPAPDDVLLRPGAVGICGSEVEGYLGRMGNRTPPLVMGHEFAGQVVATGPGAEEWAGRRVTVNPIEGCGHCALCLSGQENICPRRTLIGVHFDGAFADLVRAPAANLRALPDGLDIRTGALAEPLANGVHAVRLGLAGHSARSAAVIGAGTIGLVTLQAALLNEIASVAVIEPVEARRERARSLGAHAVFADGDAARGAAGELGFDLVLDAAGAQVTRSMAVDLVRPGGRVVCVGLAADETTLRFHTVVREQITIIGSYAYTMEDFEQSLDWLVSGRASLGELAPVLPLEEGPAAFARLAHSPPDEVKVFLAGAGREG